VESSESRVTRKVVIVVKRIRTSVHVFFVQYIDSGDVLVNLLIISHHLRRIHNVNR